MLDFSIESLNGEPLLSALWYGSDKVNDKAKRKTLLHTICYTKFVKHFERPLFDECYFFYLLILCLASVNSFIYWFYAFSPLKSYL